MMSEISQGDYRLADAGNRFDTLGGGVLYCATKAEGCYAETLARFRPSARIHALLSEEPDESFMVCGGVPRDWRTRRVKVSVTLPDALPFLDVDALMTHEHLTSQIPAELSRLHVEVLDVSDVRGHDRRITRAIATWAFNATNADGSFRFAGVRYVSRLGDYECWAVFEGADVREESRSTISLTDPDLAIIADKFELRLF